MSRTVQAGIFTGQIFGGRRTPGNICCDILLIGVSSLGVFLHFLILTFFLFDFFCPKKPKNEGIKKIAVGKFGGLDFTFKNL